MMRAISKRRRRARGAAALLLGAALAAHAADTRFPQRPLRIIVAFSSGTAVDVVARSIAARLTETLGKPVVVENRDGAAGTIGTGMAAAATADGHTLLMASTATVVSPLFIKGLPYDVARDFTPVASIVTFATVMVTAPQSKFSTVAELIGEARGSPGRLNYASAGKGSASHLGPELMRSMTGIDIVEVSYRVSGQALTDTMAGQTALFFPNLAQALPSIRAGRLKAIAVTSARRSRAAPEIPAMAETLPGYEAANWYGIVVPAKTPAALIIRLNTEIGHALAQTEVQQRFLSLGGDIAGGSVAELAATMTAARQKWTKLAGEIEARQQ